MSSAKPRKRSGCVGAGLSEPGCSRPDGFARLGLAARCLRRLAALAVLSIGAAPAAADVTFPFAGEVTSVAGTYAEFFDGAARVEGTLVFDETVVDTDLDADAGVYPGALVSLTATVEGLGYTWSANGGTLQTFLGTSSGDQFMANSWIGSASGYPVNGYPVRSLGVLFFGEDVLAGDALPGSLAGFDFGNLFVAFHDDFQTLRGQATVVFVVPEPTGAAAGLAAWTVLATVARRAPRQRCRRRPRAPTR